MARRVARGSGTLVLDAEGLSKAAANDARVGAYLKRALVEQATVVVSAVTLAEVLRGGSRDTAVHRALGLVDVADVTAAIGRKAGELLGSTGMGGEDTVDAVVAATAVAQRSRVLVLTSDPTDLGRLTSGHGDIAVIAI